MCSVRFLVLDLARLRLASWLASLAAAASRPQAISTNIIVFIVRDLAFANVVALDIYNYIYNSVAISLV